MESRKNLLETLSLTDRRDFYPAIQPYARGRLKVSGIHEIYFEESGNPRGKPVVVLHGGPGGGISPFLRQMHDHDHYRIVLFEIGRAHV